MSLVITPYVIISLLTATITTVVALVSWRLRRGRYLSLMMLAVAGWALGAALELAAVGAPAKEFWSAVEYFGTLSSPVFFFLFALEYNQQGHSITRRNIVLLFAIPFLTLLAALTNPWHHLVWTSFTPSPQGRNLIVYGHGLIWLVGVVGYTYLLVCASIGLIVGAILRFPAPYRRQSIALLLAAAIPWMLNLFYVSGYSPVTGWDPTPQAFGLSGIIFAWNLFRYQLGDLVPVARDRLIEGMQDGVMVLDEWNRVVDVNPAARGLLGTAAATAIGRPAEAVLAAWPEWVAHLRDTQEAHFEIELNDPPTRHLELTVSPLTNQRGRFGGRLNIMRDITERRRAAQERERLLAELQQALSEVRTLSGMLPICAGCKKIRDDSGYWTQIEQYIQRHSNAVFSHGLCPECVTRLYPDLKKKRD